MLEELGNKLSSFGGSIKQGATTFANSIALNNKLDPLKKELNETYIELGKAFYSKNSENAPEEHAEAFARITELEKQIADIKKELEKVPECDKEEK